MQYDMLDSNNQYEAFDLDWENPPAVKDLKTDMDNAMDFHIQHVNYVEKCQSIYDAKYHSKDKNKSQVQPKLVRKQAEWRYPALTEPFMSADDLFEVKPRSFEDKQAAEQNSLVLNYQFNNKIKKLNLIDNLVRTFYKRGTVICKLGWNYEEKVEQVEEPVTSLVPVQDPMQAQQMIDQGIPPFEETVVGYQMVDKVVVKQNHPTVEICDSRNIIIDPSCEGDLDKAGFIIHQYPTSLKDLKGDERYVNLDKIEKQSNSPLETPDYHSNTTSSFEFADKARKKFIINEYWGKWDIRGDGTVVSILACFIGDVLVRLEENPFPDAMYPFVAIPYLPNEDSVYGETDIEVLEDNQKIIGALTRGALDLMGKSANSQTGIRKDALDIVNKRKYQAGKDYEFNPNIDPRQAIHTHTFPELPASVLNLLQLQNNEAESMSGTKAFTSGISGNALGSTATGVRSALDATSKRELSILRRISTGLVEVARKIIMMNAEFLQDEEIIRLTNDEMVAINRDDLKGEFDLRLDINTAEADNEKAQELAFMLQTIGNNAGMDVTLMIMADIAKLRKMPTLAKKLEEYQPEPDPIMQERAQLENDLLKAKIAYEYSRAEENQVDKELKSAKARNLDSKTDLDDLSYIEKSTGGDIKKQASISQAQASAQSQARVEEDAAKQLLDYQRNRAQSVGSNSPNNL